MPGFLTSLRGESAARPRLLIDGVHMPGREEGGKWDNDG
jgi:hypothetical protein